MKTKFYVFVLALVFGAPTFLRAAEHQPNILWLVGEDANVTWFGCYGSAQATTPNIDRLASQGFRYVNAYATAPVCSASRSSWITGVYSLSMGTDPMRSRYAIPHDLIQYYPDYLKSAGYFCSNHAKTDYNIGGRPDTDCWNSDEEYGWDLRKPGQPFFSVVNYMDSHESRAFGSVEHTRHDPAKVMLAKYHPDLPVIRKNYALYEDAVENLDKRIGLALAALKRAGLEDDTIVIFCTDHGGVMPRSKHFIYDGGIHSPLIIRIPEKYKYLWPAERPGMVVDRLVSFVDMPKTWLSIARAPIPDIMQGKIFLGPRAEPEPAYAFAYRGRMDERFDESRVARDKRFIYIKNYMPFTEWGQHLTYMWHMKAMQAWAQFFKRGESDEINGLFFKTKPWVEELYDCATDPDNVKNLSADPEYQSVLKRMRGALKDWQLSIHDAGVLPENEMVRRAAEHHTTIYQMVRDPQLYNLPAYLAASDVALAKNESNRAALVGYLSDPDSGIRYWGACGLMMEDKFDPETVEALKVCLHDASHDVRAMAAWALVKAGDEKDGQDCLLEMIRQNSPAMLKVLNVIDWMGVKTEPYLPAIRAAKAVPGTVDDMYSCITVMKTYLLHPNEIQPLAADAGWEKRDAHEIMELEQGLNHEKLVP